MQLMRRRLSFLGTLPPDAGGTLETLKIMRSLVLRYKTDPMIRDTALSLTADVRQRDWRNEIRAIFEYVRDRIRYVRDVSRVETLQIPTVTMELEAGDCDDQSTLLATLLESVNHPSRFVAVGYDEPGRYSHVYVESKVGEAWIPLDPTAPKPFGWAPRPSVARMVVFN